MPRGSGPRRARSQSTTPWFASSGDNGAMVDAAFRQLRLAAAVVQFPFVLAYQPSGNSVELPVSNLLAAIAIATALGGINLISHARQRLHAVDKGPLLSVALLVADAAVTSVLAVMFASSGQDLAWFLMLIPVLEAGMAFGLVGALVTWVVLLAGGVAIERVQSVDSAWIGDLEALTQRLGVVLLVSIPAIHLTQMLMRDIRAERDATRDARNRGELLERVVASTQTIQRLEGDRAIEDAVVDHTLALGLDIADVCVRGDGRPWRVIASSAHGDDLRLPDPNGSLCADGLSLVVRAGEHPVVDADLGRHGLGSLVTVPLSHGGSGSSVMLRAGRRTGNELPARIADCVEIFGATVGTAFENRGLLGELRAMQGELHQQAFHDELTGLANRSQFLEELSRRLEMVPIDGSTVAIAFVDLDRFKPVNDSLGHDVGNELLVAVGRRLERAVRDSDLVARFGGDEFVILVDEVDAGDTNGELAGLADRVCEAISTPFHVAGHEVVISCSVGVALTDRESTAEELVRRADVAMYRAKGTGKARWVPYQQDLDDEVVRRAQLETDLRRAIGDGDIDVAYQAILAVRDGTVAACEALIRWNHPTLGPQPPDLVVGVAEEAGMIDELGHYVLERAATDAAAWQRRVGSRAPAVAVNVSARQLFHPRFFEMFDEVLASSGVDPTGLIVEVTENLVAHGEDFEAHLHDVRRRGVRTALDDFGEGTSSLSYLRRSPLDILKLDKALVSDASGTSDRAILRSIIQMAHDLGLVVVAEGVESITQMRLLRDLGCDLAQGYLLHRPDEAAAFEARYIGPGTAPAPATRAPVAATAEAAPDAAGGVSPAATS